MKKSNLFIILGALFTLGLPLVIIAFTSKYVSVEEFQANQRETIKSLDTDTYNYKTIVFDEPFVEVIIKDTSKRISYQGKPVTEIQWVRSNRSGLKISDYGRRIESANVEQNKLIILVNSSNSSGGQLVFYSPSLTKITAEGVPYVSLVDTENDSLTIESASTSVAIAKSNLLKNLTIQAKGGANVTVEAISINEATYLLSNSSTIRSQIDSCNRLSIQGDSSSNVSISPLYEVRESADNSSQYTPRSTYKYMSFNDEIGSISIENAEIMKIKGNKDRLKLNMSIKQIEKTLANIEVD